LKQSFFHRRVIQPVVALLTQGITPEKIALSLAFGIVLGVFPVIGSTSLLCAAAALLLRLNLPAIQLVNYVVYPLQVLLIVPFIRAGEFLFRARPLQLSLAQMLAMARTDLPHAITVLWVSALYGVAAWLLVGPLALFLLYFLFLYLVRQLTTVAEKRPDPAIVA
jgi:uncharacterized protein (DUF2062 family)